MFGVLLQRALARGRVRLASYLRSVAGVVVCGAGAAAGEIAVHAVLPGPPIGRSRR